MRTSRFNYTPFADREQRLADLRARLRFKCSGCGYGPIPLDELTGGEINGHVDGLDSYCGPVIFYFEEK